jgi:AcrR family transcriptional regulator
LTGAADHDFLNHVVGEIEPGEKRGRGRPPAGPERRDALVLATYHAIARDGFEGLRMRAIATEAGVDHSTIRHYFESKEALIEAVAAYATGQFRSTTPAAGTAVERLAAHLRTLADRIVSEPGLHAVLRELDLRAKRDDGLRATIDALEDGWRGSLTGVLTEARRDGTLNQAVIPRDAAELIIATVKGASLGAATARTVLDQLFGLLTTAGDPC